MFGQAPRQQNAHLPALPHRAITGRVSHEKIGAKCRSSVKCMSVRMAALLGFLRKLWDFEEKQLLAA